MLLFCNSSPQRCTTLDKAHLYAKPHRTFTHLQQSKEVAPAFSVFAVQPDTQCDRTSNPHQLIYPTRSTPTNQTQLCRRIESVTVRTTVTIPPPHPTCTTAKRSALPSGVSSLSNLTHSASAPQAMAVLAMLASCWGVVAGEGRVTSTTITARPCK
jgi:hypothetical protein